MNEQQLAKKPQLSYTKDQVELVKSQIAPEATVDEQALTASELSLNVAETMVDKANQSL